MLLLKEPPHPPHLPRDWSCAFNKDTGRTFYWHKKTKEASWKRPHRATGRWSPCRGLISPVRYLNSPRSLADRAALARPSAERARMQHMTRRVARQLYSTTGLRARGLASAASGAPRPFRVLGLQQVAIGGLDKGPLTDLWQACTQAQTRTQSLPPSLTHSLPHSLTHSLSRTPAH